MLANVMNRKVVIMAKKDEEEVGLCDVWTLEMHLAHNYFFVNHGGDLKAKVQYREDHISPRQTSL